MFSCDQKKIRLKTSVTVLFRTLCAILEVADKMSEVRWYHGPKCRSAARVEDKTIIVTGSNTGIGKETVRELASRGGRVIMACRDIKKAQEAADEITRSLEKATNPGTVVVHRLDLASLASVREFAQNINNSEARLDILINNAGIMACPQWKTEEGFDMQMGVNHFGHFLLTMLLLDKLKQSAPARIVNVSSLAHQGGKIKFDDINCEKNYSAIKAYCDSKLANVLFTRELAKRLSGTGVTTYVLHPGAISTELGRHVGNIISKVGYWIIFSAGKVFLKNPVEGAQTTLYCALSEELKDRSGLYYSGCKETQPSSEARKDDVALKLWNLSCELTGFEST